MAIQDVNPFRSLVVVVVVVVQKLQSNMACMYDNEGNPKHVMEAQIVMQIAFTRFTSLPPKAATSVKTRPTCPQHIERLCMKSKYKVQSITSLFLGEVQPSTPCPACVCRTPWAFAVTSLRAPKSCGGAASDCRGNTAED